MTYAEALAYIAGLEPRGWRLGLDRMAEFIHRAGLDAAVDGSRRQYIHVAGTNGKGSVTAYLQSLMVSSGQQTGAFFSPFVVDPRERVQLGREFISREMLADLTSELKVIAEGMDGTEFAGVTEFEFKTGVGFLAWERADAKWVALETGLGGRLDATNVVTPAASVIVSIGLDHQAILGSTVENIAFEKAGIIKPGRPVVVGQLPDSARQVIEEVAAERGSPVWRFGRDFQWEAESGTVTTPSRSYAGLRPGFIGIWQGHNAALAIAAAEVAGLPITEEQVREGIARAYAPGRFERLNYKGREVILDGAHNADSAKALAETLRAEGAQEVVLVTNMLFGHEPAEFYGPLCPLSGATFVPPIDFHRSRPPEETAIDLRKIGFNAKAVNSLGEALDEAVNSPGEAPILVTGSFYLVGEALNVLRAAQS